MPASSLLAGIGVLMFGLPAIVLSFALFRFAFHWRLPACISGGVLCCLLAVPLWQWTDRLFFSLFKYKWLHLVDDTWNAPTFLLVLGELYVTAVAANALGTKFMTWWDRNILKVPPSGR